VGTILILLPLIVFVLSRPSLPISVGAETIGGFVLLMISLAGLIIVSQAVGVTTPLAALGLPGGSVRALLAFSMVIAFVAIASTTLSDRGTSGAVVYTQDVDPSDAASVSKAIQTAQATFPPPRFLTFVNSSAKTVQVVDSESQRQVFDLQKQILTIIATALVTVIGFYFGSKTSSDATVTAQQNLGAMQTALAGGLTGTAVSLDDVKNLAVDIRNRANGIQSQLDGLGGDPLADLKAGVTSSSSADLQAQLAQATTALETLKRNAAAADAAADAAEAEVAKLTAASDAATLAASKKTLESLRDSLAGPITEFNTTLETFSDANDFIRSATADG
jgi:hypothetical protein